MKRRCKCCGREFTGGVTWEVCSNSCLQILRLRVEQKIRDFVRGLR
jgi:hypothetical protein